MLHRLRLSDQIEWGCTSIDSAGVLSPGGTRTGPSPTDAGKLDCKHHVVVDQRGVPLVAQISGADVHDLRLLQPLTAALPAWRQWLQLPVSSTMAAPSGHRSPHRPARRRIARAAWKWRWMVERTFSWLDRLRRLRVRYARRGNVDQAFRFLACASIC